MVCYISTRDSAQDCLFLQACLLHLLGGSPLRGLGTEHLSMDGNHVLTFKLEDNQHVYVDWDKL